MVTRSFIVEVDVEELPEDGQEVALTEAVGFINTDELDAEDVFVLGVRVFANDVDFHELLMEWDFS